MCFAFFDLPSPTRKFADLESTPNSLHLTPWEGKFLPILGNQSTTSVSETVVIFMKLIGIRMVRHGSIVAPSSVIPCLIARDCTGLPLRICSDRRFPPLRILVLSHA